jgi:hypothetical protein
MHPKHAFLVRCAAVASLLLLATLVIRGLVYADTSELSDGAKVLAGSLLFFAGAICGWLIAALLMRAHRFFGTWIPRDLYFLLHGVDKPIGKGRDDVE